MTSSLIQPKLSYQERFHAERKPYIQTMQKTSGPRVHVGENADSWETAAFDALVAQHPWVTKLKVVSRIATSSPQGYATGSFYLTPRNIPASASGSDRINVITVPILIKDYRLFPLDVYLYKNAFYPLSEERVMQIIQLPDLFMESDRSETSLMPHFEEDYVSGGMSRSFGGSRARGSLAGLYGKYSSDGSAKQELHALKLTTTNLLVDGLHQSYAKISSLKNSILGERKEHLQAMVTRDPLLHTPIAHALRNVQYVSDVPKTSSTKQPTQTGCLSVVEVRKSNAGIESRDWWAEHPDTGRPKVSSWESVSYHDVEKGLGREKALQLLKDGYARVRLTDSVKTSFAQDVTAQLEQEALSRLSEMHEPYWLDPKEKAPAWVEDFAKTSGYAEACKGESPSSRKKTLLPCVRLQFVNPQEHLGLPKTFEGYVVYSPDIDHFGEGPRSVRHEAIGMLVDGTLHLVHSFWELKDLRCFCTDKKVIFECPEIHTVRELERPDSTFVRTGERILHYWNENGHLMGCITSTQSSNIDGVTYLHSENGFGYEDPSERGLIKVCPDIRAAMTEKFSLGTALCIPNAKTLPFQTFPSPEEMIPLTDEGTPSLPIPVVGDELVAVRVPGGMKVSHPLLQGAGIPEDAVLEGRMLGAAFDFLGLPWDVQEKISQATQSVDVVQFTVESGDSVTQKELVRQAQKHTDHVLQKLSSVMRSIPNSTRLLSMESSFCGLMGLRSAPQNARTKVSSLALNMSLDSALSLNFLNPQTLMKFIDYIEPLEDCVSKLCALLIASRIGLSEVPEEYIKMAVDGLEPTVQGLRILDMTLRKAI